MKLIQHRGPKRFTTDFDKSLFISQAMAIAMKALFDGKHCFLGHDDWIATLRSATSSDPKAHPDRSELMISFTEISIRFTNLMKDATDLFLDQLQGRTEAIEARRRDLLREAKSQRETYLAWAHRWAEELSKPSTHANDRFVHKCGQRDTELTISSSVSNIAFCRILAALDDDQGLAREREAQKLARELLDKLNTPDGTAPGVSAHICWATGRAILATADDWEEIYKSGRESQKFTDPNTLRRPNAYFRWIALTGFRLPDGCSRAGLDIPSHSAWQIPWARAFTAPAGGIRLC
ncbi:hypothetical protein K4F52_001066 [Lecanicillium sp. MT-2017a]|nr:hypothetical protein K4F52_001066 [Lecanicillium sp. MT-2017a]